jgi:L-alanine-DL-glutamate epimerase-like enolase superfamily enzyme
LSTVGQRQLGSKRTPPARRQSRAAGGQRFDVEVSGLDVSAYQVPTDEPESDGTLEWDSTTLVLVEAHAGDETGIGFTYGDAAVAALISSKLADAVAGADALAPPAAWRKARSSLRNAGREGVGSMAISAVDIALWDLKARLLGLALADALPRFRSRVPVYGSGGFCSYAEGRLREQLGGWVADGIPRVKMKVGRDPERDERRVRVVREEIGTAVELMVDANGAYSRKEALRWAELYAAHGVCWLEEPVSSDDLDGLRLVRDRGPAGMAIAAGEYGWEAGYFERMLAAGAVDVLQADVTRCGGITGFLAVDALCRARSVPLSAHCAPAISAHACCALGALEHLEYFHDHVRIESMLFDGALEPTGGYLEPDRERPGLGLELKRGDAEEYEVR